MTMTWVRVNKAEPCPVCDKPDWCTVSSDGAIVCCMRVQSDWPMRNGGFGHKLKERPTPPRRAARPRRRTSSPPGGPPDFAGIMASWAKRQDGRLDILATDLGLEVPALRRLGPVPKPGRDRGVWAFPMRDAERNIIGIRLRAETGAKWAVKGSKSGLFFPELYGRMTDPIVVCEGPTDTAALLHIGYDAIGRPSCLGNEEMVCDVADAERRDVVIMADRDGPGQRGARKLARELTRAAPSVKIVTPPAGKDAREWVVQYGGTRPVLDVVIRNARLFRG